MKKIIISETEEHGQFDSLSSMAVFTIETEDAVRLSAMAVELSQRNQSFSEYREFGCYAQFFNDGSPEQIIRELEKVAEPDSQFTLEDLDKIQNQYYRHQCFVLPEHFESMLESIVDDLTQTDNSMSVDIEEIIVDKTHMRGAAYDGSAPIFTQEIPHEWVCS